MLAITTCKDCLDRSVGCHGICQKYLGARAENERKKEWLYQKIGAENDINVYKMNLVDNTKRRKH